MKKLKPNQFKTSFGAVITEHPILFQGEMVQANLQDRKTQTRRLVKDELLQNNQDEKLQEFLELTMKSCPYGMPGDLLWVRETWGVTGFDYLMYKADYDSKNDIRNALINDRWTPSIHMPKVASRIWAMIEEIRVERVQDISEQDAIAEGVIKGESIVEGYFRFRDYKSGFNTLKYAKSSFESLWASINGADSWNSNPWVWVIQYRILSKTGKPNLDLIEKNYKEVVYPPRVLKPLEGSTGEEVSHA